MFFELHVWNPIHQQSAKTVTALKHRDIVPPLVELVCHGKPGRAASNHRHSLVRADFGRLCSRQSGLVGTLYNGILIFLCRNCVTMQSAGTGMFTERRAYPCRKLWKVIGFLEAVISALPVSCIDQIIPLRHQIVKRTASSHAGDRHPGLTERHAALHASCPLLLLFLHRKMLMKFIKMLDSLLRRFRRRSFSLII